MITTNIVNYIEDLPTLSNSFNEICRVSDNPASSGAEIARVVERDQVLAARVLKLINSVFYGMPKKIARVEQGITLLGINAIKNLILASSVFKDFGGQKEIEGIWIHALAVGTAAKVIGQKLNYREIEDLFICGLLHDIGKVVEYRFHPEDVRMARKKSLDDKQFYWQVENEIFETGHEQIGHLLLSRWKLPKKYCNVVAFHHHPHPKKEYFLETTTICWADALVRSLEIGDSWDGNLVPESLPQLTSVVKMEILGNEELSQLVIAETESVMDIFYSD